MVDDHILITSASLGSEHTQPEVCPFTQHLFSNLMALVDLFGLFFSNTSYGFVDVLFQGISGTVDGNGKSRSPHPINKEASLVEDAMEIEISVV